MTMEAGREQTVVLKRATKAVRVPWGDQAEIPEGTKVRVVQALGGSYTVVMGGNLLRVDGTDADALGFDVVEAPKVDASAGDEDVERHVWEQLATCYDPEIPINVVDLGLVYSCMLSRMEDGRRRVEVKMTLTAPGCGMGPVLVEDVTRKLQALPAVGEAVVELVFDPPWSRDMMSDAAKLQTGML